MRKGRFARSVRVGFLVIVVATAGLAAWSPGANAFEQNESRVTPVILHACPSANGLETVWGYDNTSNGNVTITLPDNGDDTRIDGRVGDGDDDDNFFVPAPDSRGQVTTFLPGPHDAVTTDEPAPTTWVLGTNVVTSSAPLNCADVQVTKTQLLETVTAGQQEQYTVTATNAGPTTASGVAVSDTLPAGATGVSATSGQTTCAVASGTVTCNPVTTLPVNGSITVTITATLPGAGSLTDTASATATTFDPNTTNNVASVTTTVSAAGGSSGGGILSQGQQLTVNSGTATNTRGTVKVQTGTVPLTLRIEPQSQCPPGATCKSDILDVEPHANPAGQTLTAVFDTGKPSPFVLIPFVKFMVNKNGVDKPLPVCRPYLRPQPLPDGSACEYFRWMNRQGHAIVYVALGAQDPRLHR